MKKIAKGLIVMLLVSGLSTGPEIHRASATPPHISVQVFFDALSPYGRWITYGGYGYAWVPAVEVGFIPYATAGHWVFTSLGWTWVSDYPWGWAPFHYGRWIYDDFYGWIWIPGTEWAPAWVVWAQSDDYYGWAPLPPGLDISVHISIGRYIPYSRWVFVPGAYLCSPAPYRYYVYPRNQVNIIQHITIINQVYVQDHGPRYFYGPRPESVQRYVGRPLRPVAVIDASRPEETRFDGNAVRIFRPAVQEVPHASPRVFAGNQQESRPVNNNHVRFMSPFGSDAGAGTSEADAHAPRTFSTNGDAGPFRTSPSGEANTRMSATDATPATPENRMPMRTRQFDPVPVDRTPSVSGGNAGSVDSRNMAPSRVFTPSHREDIRPAPRPEGNHFSPDAFRHPIMNQPPARSFDGAAAKPQNHFERRFQGGNDKRRF